MWVGWGCGGRGEVRIPTTPSLIKNNASLIIFVKFYMEDGFGNSGSTFVLCLDAGSKCRPVGSRHCKIVVWGKCTGLGDGIHVLFLICLPGVTEIHRLHRAMSSTALTMGLPWS